jgi:hypothetical protein
MTYTADSPLIPEHLPDCLMTTPGEHGDFYAECICDRLRAAEQQATAKAHEFCFQKDNHEAFDAGVKAERDRIRKGVDELQTPLWFESVMAVIDGPHWAPTPKVRGSRDD